MLFGREQLLRGTYFRHLDGRIVGYCFGTVSEVTDQITAPSIRRTHVDPNKHKRIGQLSK